MATLVVMEPPLKYHPDKLGVLTLARYPGWGQCMAGSLTGAVSSQRVTEEHKGTLGTVGHRTKSVKAQGSLTGRPTSRAETKVGLSDPTALSGKAVAYRIKATPGITG